jgi:hypothetical protein
MSAHFRGDGSGFVTMTSTLRRCAMSGAPPSAEQSISRRSKMEALWKPQPPGFDLRERAQLL